MEEPKISTRPIGENRSSYRSWVESEGIPLIEGFFIEDIRKVRLEPWARTGGLACRICLTGTGETNDAYICEIPAGKALKPQRHLFEELIYIVRGHGATTVWNHPESKHTFEWQEGSVFSPPLNSWYQHFNGNGSEPARYLAVTSAPCMMNLLHSTDFIFNCDYVFTDRFNSQTDYFSSPGTWYAGRTWQTNFVADVKNLKLLDWRRGVAAARRFAWSFPRIPCAVTFRNLRWDRTRKRIFMDRALTSLFSAAWDTPSCGRRASRSNATIGRQEASWSRQAIGFTSTSTRERSLCAIWLCVGAARSTMRCGAKEKAKSTSMLS
jgi:hypothetical protein